VLPTRLAERTESHRPAMRQWPENPLRSERPRAAMRGVTPVRRPQALRRGLGTKTSPGESPAWKRWACLKVHPAI
jgi:hypothetical protein